MPFHARAIGEKEDRGGGGERVLKDFEFRFLSAAWRTKKERNYELNDALLVFLGPASECLSTELARKRFFLYDTFGNLAPLYGGLL